MPYVPSVYWVRVQVSDSERGHDAYPEAQSLAMRLARQNPGLTFEVMEDKVWASHTTGGKSGTQELQDSRES